MAVKKDIFENYTKLRESNELKNIIEKHAYTHNKVFGSLPQKEILDSESLTNTNDNEWQNLKTNREQFGNNSGTQPGTNREQTGNKSGTNREQNGNNSGTQPGTHSGTIREQFGNKSGTKREQFGNKPGTNREQIKNTCKKETSLSMLTGLQREVIVYIYNLCKTSGTKSTNKISLDFISSGLQKNAEIVKTTIKRLNKKGCLIRLDFKPGRGGWSKYELPDNIFRELLQNCNQQLYLIREQFGNNSGTNREQTGNNSGTQPGTQRGTNVPSSSSYYINSKTTTKENSESIEPDNNLPIEWKKINYELLRHIGFSETQLLQLYSQKLNPEIVQESIHHFSFGLENVEKTKSYNEPLNVFMGVLRQGHAWIEPTYESATDRALKQMLERRKQEEEKRQELYKEFFEIEYKKWLNGISDEELKELLPKADFSFGRYTGEIEHQAKSLFRRTEWEVIYEGIKTKTTS
jgi:hypothetical protein